LSFDGDNDRVDCGNDESLDITDALTIAAWVNPNTVNVAWQRLVWKGIDDDDWPAQYILLLHYDEFQFRYYTAGEGGWMYVESLNADLVPGNWYFLVTTYDSGDTKVYLDGVLSNSGTLTSSLYSDEYSVKIGAPSYFPAPDGIIELVRIWHRVLSAAEIWQLYTDPFCMFYHPLEAELMSSTIPGVVSCLDNLGGTASSLSSLSLTCQSSDSISSVDSELSHLLLYSALIDKFHSKDVSISNITFGRTILDIFSCQDTSSLLKGIIASATALLSIQDLNEVHLILSSSSIDIIKEKDNSTINVTFHLSGDDILGGSDFTFLNLQAILNALDSLKISDSSLSAVFAEVLASASDILTTSDYNEVRLEFLQSVIDIVKSEDSSSPIISFRLNSTDVLQGLDILTVNLEAILSAISKFKSSGETSSYEVMLGIPIKIFKAQEKVLVFKASKKELTLVAK